MSVSGICDTRRSNHRARILEVLKREHSTDASQSTFRRAGIGKASG
jgi:hypothetical protein